MSIMSRIVALELVHKPKAKEFDRWEYRWEYQSAWNRREARIRRGMRVLAERIVRAECADLEPIEFNVEVGELLGERELWSPYTIWADGRQLAGDLDTPEQQRRDEDLINSWRADRGMEPVPGISALTEAETASYEGYESPSVLSSEDREQQLRQAAQHAADEYSVDVGQVYAELERFADGVERLREHLERKAACSRERNE
jgi:hypothetical protein